MDEAIKQKLNRVYGRGFYDGMKAANEDPQKELTMNESRFKAVYRGLTEQAKKVYAAVPVSEHWTVPQIMAELSRTTGQRDQRIVSGCLNSLKEVGLVKELPNNIWVRVDIRTKVATIQEPESQTPPHKEEPAMPPINTQPVAQKPTTNTTPLERIGGLSSQVLTIIQSLHQLAADIEATALEVEEQVEKVQKDSVLLKQFQELLKGLQR